MVASSSRARVVALRCAWVLRSRVGTVATFVTSRSYTTKKIQSSLKANFSLLLHGFSLTGPEGAA